MRIFVVGGSSPVAMLPTMAMLPPMARTPSSASMSLLSSPLAFSAVADTAAVAEAPADVLASLQAFQSNHAFLIGILVTLLTRYLINEARYRIEKPVMDEFGNRVSKQVTTNLMPDTEQIEAADWAKLIVCIVMDLAGDASELIPFLGEFTDLGFAPIEAAGIKLLFQSNSLAAFGFVEEILPFTDVIPTFTISWMIANLFGTTPLAKKLGVAKT